MTFKKPALLSEEELSEILTLADLLAAWAADVWSYATEVAISQGKRWQGFKLVEGRANRKYKDEAMAAKVVLKAGFKKTDIYKKSLIGISEMEKLLGKKQFSEVLAGLIEKPQGKPTLVPESDKRPAMNLQNSAEEDFKN